MIFKKMGSSSFPNLDGLIKIIVFALGILPGQLAMAQGWERDFGGSSYDEGTAIAEAIDGGFILVGYSESFGDDGDLDVYLVRTDIDGNVLWEQNFDIGFMEHGFGILPEPDGTFTVVGDYSASPGSPLNVLFARFSKEGKSLGYTTYTSTSREVGKDIVKASDGGYLILGSSEETSSGASDILLLKVDASGQLEWKKLFGGPNKDEGNALVALEDGYVFAGSSDNPNGFDDDILLIRTDKEGNERWVKRIATEEEGGASQPDVANDLILTSDNHLVMTGYRGFSSDALVLKYTLDGEEVWSSLIGGSLGDEASSVLEKPDGALVIGGLSETSESNIDILMAQIDGQSGAEQWRSIIGDSTYYEDCKQIITTRDGRFASIGLKSVVLEQLNDIVLVRTDNLGNINSNYFSGKVYRDADGGCNGYDVSQDELLSDWLVRVTNTSTKEEYYGTTDEKGNFSIRVDTGSYNVSVLPVNSYWSSCLAEGVEFSFTEFYDSTTINFPVISETVCPYLEVDISTPFLADCSDVEYHVDYCNIGTGPAQDAYVEVLLSDELTFKSASIPVAAQAGNLYTFNLGDLASNQCGSFSIQTELACSGIAQGQAALASASIFPDTLCVEPDPNWDESSVVVTGKCNLEKDSVEFEIKNSGSGDMSQPSNYIVIQDDLILFNKDVTLPAGVGDPVSLPADGSTYRVIAEQTPYHPGRSYPTAFVEGCVEEGNPFTTGVATMFPENDLDPHKSIDVQEIYGSGNPVSLRGYPKGYGDESLVASNTDITYTVIFRNTGTDTTTRVVIRDTLPPGLDVGTVQPGASSHPYDFEAYDGGVLKFTFSDLELLPEGSAGDAASYGFVKFRVSQKPNNPEGTVLENHAAVYFDYLMPATTNTIRHEIGEFPTYITTKIEQVFWPGVEINVSPNPFYESTVFDIEGFEFKNVVLSVFDVSGRPVHQSRHNGNKIMYYRNGLPSGLYFFRLESEGQLISSGKLIVR